MAPESFQYRKAMSDPILNDPAALQNMDILGAHLYGTQVRDFPYPLFKEKGAGKELWMTEVYYPNSEDNSADRWPEALGVAWHIHSAMVEAEFQAYVWWYIPSSVRPHEGGWNESASAATAWRTSPSSSRRGSTEWRHQEPERNEVFVSAYKATRTWSPVIVNRNTLRRSRSVSIPRTTITSFAKYTTLREQEPERGRPGGGRERRVHGDRRRRKRHDAARHRGRPIQRWAPAARPEAVARRVRLAAAALR
jgi:glucuronoarabinoxylan endo-1,4-beta-xylanase